MEQNYQNENQETLSALQIKCPGCGGPMMYAPRAQNLQCVYCGVTKPLSVTPAEIQENDFVLWAQKNEEEKAQAEQEQTMVAQQVKCAQCGATIQLDAAKQSTNCPYCGTPLMLENAQVKRFWQPEYLLPFAIDKKDCNGVFSKWLNGKWFFPSKYKKETLKGEKFQGIYYPYWTYDAHTVTSYIGERGTDRKVRSKDSNGNITTRTVTKWQRACGTVIHDFDDILVAASKDLPEDLVKEHKSWPLKDLVQYSPEFTAGFTTDVYTINFTEGVEIAKAEMEDAIESDICKDIGGDRQRINSKDVTYKDLMFKLILLPLWIGIFKIDGKTYQFMINGRTGEVHGDYPLDKLKVTLVVLAVLVLVALLIYFMW